jgi:hypothetical protein
MSAFGSKADIKGRQSDGCFAVSGFEGVNEAA